ncbi:MAG: succinylglutamate desuccinylase/aspartoacylase family protein [Verrucomicrobiota bacterium]|nr:succinylglutamate desuccinylase/aspartoacylase family protein [Verrucomicrobiota bacterium]
MFPEKPSDLPPFEPLGLPGWALEDEEERDLPPAPSRSFRQLLQPLFERIAESASSWHAEGACFRHSRESRYWMPRLVFARRGEQPSIKLAIFAGIHGDEPAGVHALCDLAGSLDAAPALARQYLIHAYPLCNPSGYEDGARHSRSGKDLNREFWRGSPEPEVQLLEREILREKYDGLISLHSDDTSDGLYGFVRGATLTEHLLTPALAMAEQMLPVNQAPLIDGFHAVNGIIHSAYDGILSAPPNAKPQPFEIILESPAHAPLHLQRAALVLAVTEIIRHYRRLIAYGADL